MGAYGGKRSPLFYVGTRQGEQGGTHPAGSRNVFAVPETEPWTHRALMGSQRLAIGLAVIWCIPRFLGWLAQLRAFLACLTWWLVCSTVMGVTEWRDG